MPSDVDAREEQIAQFGRAALRGSAVELGLQLGQLVFEVGERAGEIGVLEPHSRRPPLHLPGAQERRQRIGDVVEHAFAPLLLALDLFPVRPHAPRRLGLDVAEHVRVAPHELLVDQAGSLLEVALAALLEQEREEVDLEEEIAELVEQLRRVAREGGVGDLVSLLHRVRHDRPRGLLPVPGTVAPEALAQLLEIEESTVETAAGFVSQPVVVPVVVVAGGARPGAYETLLLYSFSTVFSQVCTLALVFCWSSCCLIEALTSENGLV
jgi:hypothetical protein